jgi:transcriptional regulator with GAF, ATPase, and Fis domain
MDPEEVKMELSRTSQVAKLETRDRELAILSMIVTFISAFSLVAIYLSLTLEPLSTSLLDPFTQRALVISFFLLITLFCAYVVAKRREIHRVKSRLIEEELKVKTMDALLAELIDLYKVSSSVSSDMDLATVLNIVLETCATSLKVDRVLLYIHDPVSDELRTEANMGEEMDWERWEDLHMKIARSVLESREPLIINDRGTFAQFTNTEPESIASLSEIYAPLRSEEGCLGVLEVIASSEWHFSEHDLKLASILADHAAIAISRNRKTQALEAHVQDLEMTNRILMETNKGLQGAAETLAGSIDDWKSGA